MNGLVLKLDIKRESCRTVSSYDLHCSLSDLLRTVGFRPSGIKRVCTHMNTHSKTPVKDVAGMNTGDTNGHLVLASRTISVSIYLRLTVVVQFIYIQ